MVMQRRLDYGFNAYPVPVVPRASRSARGRGPSRKKQEEKPIHAFEILASVAGKILRESETSSPNDPTCVKDHYGTNRDKDEGLSLKVYHEVCDEKTSASVVHHQNFLLNEVSNCQDNFSSGISLVSRNCDRMKRICFAENVTAKSAYGSSCGKALGDLAHDGKYFDGEIEKIESEPSKVKTIKNETSPVSSSKEFMKLDKRSPTHVGSQSDIKAPSLRDSEAIGLFPRRCVNINLVSRDDDENFVGCSQRGTIGKAYRSLPDIEEQRMSDSKNPRVCKSLKAGGYSRNDVKPEPIYNYERPSYARQRCERIVPFKKRKHFHQSSLSSSDGGFGFEDAFRTPDKVNDEECAVGGRMHAAGASLSVASQQAHQESRDSNVKLSIRSFKVPELFIEIPATATIGSLKRTVMEAVTSILGDGLHVGILLQGKKVRDDNKTLIQTGISQEDKLHSLGFMLEPRHGQISSSPLCTEEPPSLSGSATRTLTRHSGSWNSQPRVSGISSKSLLTNSSSCTDCDHDAVHSLGDTSNDNNINNSTMSESRALVAVPGISMKALTVVPFHRKVGHPEFVKRRIRRPFSVSEVEALVQAVEKLGTGRWRDVKMRAFDSAKHRTYVDLKDKWKTLVHTAKISPQQRRGEPVPQELLDRVLAAHAYWSQQQARQVKSVV